MTKRTNAHQIREAGQNLSRNAITTGSLEESMQKMRDLEQQGFTFMRRILADELLEKIYHDDEKHPPTEIAAVLVYDKNEPIYLVYAKNDRN